MKDFSLLYGPVRTWLPVLAMVVLAVAVVLNQSSGSERGCERSDSIECHGPLLGERQLLGRVDGFDVAPVGPLPGQAPDESPLGTLDRSTSEVPLAETG